MKKHWKKLVIGLLVLTGAGVAAAGGTDFVDKVDSNWAQWFVKGAYFGPTIPDGGVSATTPLMVNGNLQVNGTVTSSGGNTQSGDLLVKGDAGVTGNLETLGNFHAAAASTFDTSATVTGFAYLNSDVNILGDAGFADNIRINGDAGIKGQLDAILGLQVGPGAGLDFLTDQGGVLTTDGGMKVQGTLAVTGATTFPTTAAGGAVSYYAGGPEIGIMPLPLVALANTTKLGGYGLPGVNSVGTARAFTIQALTGAVTTASGAGAANSVITITDGTNTCTVTIPCNSNAPAGSQNTGAIRIAAVNGAGTGCVYPAGAAITDSVTTAGCTTTQPTLNALLVGQWQ